MGIEVQARRGGKPNELNTGNEDTSTELSIIDSTATARAAVNQEDINAMVAAMNAAVLDTTDPNFIRSQIETLGSTAFDRVNREQAVQRTVALFRQDINEAIENQQIDRLVETENERQKAIDTASRTRSPEAFSASLSNPETENRIAEARFNSRLATLNKLINETVEKNAPGIIGGIGEFADLFISAPFDALALGGFSRTEDAQTIANLMAADIPEDQFEAEAKAAIERAADAGVFTDSNIFFLLSMVENINQRGKGTEAQLDRFFNVLDLAGITGTAVQGSAKILRAARNGTSLASAMGGPKAGAKVLAEGISRPNTSIAESAGVGRESVPSVMRHPENFNAHKNWTAPGVEISARLKDEDSYLNYVRSLNFSQRIDPKVFEEWKPIGLQRLREDIAAEKHSRLLNLDIDQDDAGNLYGIIHFGKKDGMPFTDKGNATKAARQLNGQLEETVGAPTPRKITEFDSETVGKQFEELAKEQRGEPESAMSRVQFAMGGGILNPVVERAGDTLHRTFEFASRGEFVRGDALEKINTVRRSLNQSFGFEREFNQNIVNNADARGISIAEMEARVGKALDSYTEAYKNLLPKAVNNLQKRIIEGNIAIGEQRWDDARKIFDELHEIYSDPQKFDKAVKDIGDLKDTELPIDEAHLGGQTFYMIRVEKNIPTEGLARELTNEEIGQVYYGMLDDLKLLGGSFLSIPRRLDSLAKRGEGVFSRAAKDINKRLEKKVRQTPTEDKKIVEKMLFELRDGEHSFRRDAFNQGEFISEFARLSNGRQPSQAAIDMYFDIQEVNDSFYLLKADQMFKKAVDKGYGEVVQFDLARADGNIDSFNIVSKRIAPDQMGDTDVAINPISGERFTKDAVNRNHTVFRVADEFEQGQEEFRFLVFEQPKTRRLYHTDVLGYNPGGPRQYDTLKFTVKQEKVGGRPRTIMGAETSVQAEKGMNQINEILKAARDRIGGFAGLSRAQKIDAIEELGDDLGDVIRRNNEFDPDIETTADFAAFLRSQRIDPGQNVGMARLNQPVLTETDTGDLIHLGGDTLQEVMESGFNQPAANGPRRDVPLRGFGGTALETKSPLETIQNDYLRILHNKAFGAFNFQAVNGWLKGAKNLIANQNEIAGMDPMRAMNAAKFIDEDSHVARNFKAARSAINRVMNTKTGYEQKWDSLIDRTVDFVFQKGFKKTGKAIDKNSRDPATALRGWSFDARLGMLAFDQLFVQSSQFFNMIAIVGLKRTPDLLRSAATHVPVRIAMNHMDNPEMLRTIARRSKAFTGMDEDEFLDFADWVHESGRLEIGGEVAELSNMSPVAGRGFIDKTRNAARVFFNEGEKFPRATALRIAWDEYKRTFPRADVRSEHAIQWITGRQDALFAAMTRASRSELQRGPQSIPFQFFTYIQRMQESLLTDRLLTGPERRRLAIAQFFFWGAAGAGLGQVTVDSAVNEGKVLGVKMFDGGVSMDEFTYTSLRYGLLNASINEAIGTQRMAFGERIAPAAGVADFIRKIGDNNFTELLGGPALDLTVDVWQRMPRVMDSIVSGNTTMVVEDAKQMLRNVSSFNRGYQAWYMAQYGDYISKNNNKVVSGLTESDALMTFIGNQVQEANLAFDRAGLLKSQREHLRTHQSRIEEMVFNMELALREDRPEDAEAIGQAIAREMAILKPYQFNQVYKGLSPQIESMAEEMFHKVREQGYENAGRIIREDQE